ncbi:hypothetical protein [Tolypothrix sp. VBCCA 56010]|uniref:hypothetical protein n=1 Tax=Tolypothrix sp. VBCCA 56010 TaxID=3137731 RepID=UPI003D7D19EB
MSTVPLSVRIPVNLLDKLDAKASELNSTRTDYVLAILAQAAGVTLQPRGSVDEVVDSRIQAMEKRLTALEKQIQSVVNQPTSEVLSQADLAKRLKVNPSTIYKRRDYSTKFFEWTSSRDPLGWAWEPVPGASPLIYRRVRKRG